MARNLKQLCLQKFRKNESFLLCFIFFVITSSLAACFWTGNVFSFPQDETLYYYCAENIALGRVGSYKPPEDYLSSKYLNPAHLIYARHVYNFVNAQIFSFFKDTYWGFPLLSLLLYPLPCFLLLLVGRKREVPLSFIFFFSVCYLSFPGLLVCASRILPDTPIASLLACAYIFIVIKGRSKKEENWFFLLSGIFCGFAYLLKEGALLMVLPLLMYVFFFRIRTLPVLLLGFLAVMAAEMAMFYEITGDPFVRQIIIHKAHLWKYMNEYGAVNKVEVLPFFTYVSPANYPYFYHIKYFFHFWNDSLAVSYVGYHFLFLVPASLYFLFFRRSWPKFIRAAPCLLGLVAGYLLLEFGFTDITWSEELRSIVYLTVFKEGDSPKFSLLLSFAAAFVSASFLYSLYDRGKWFTTFAWLLAISFLAVQLSYVASARVSLHDGVKGLMETAELLDQTMHDKNFTIYIDRAGQTILNYFTGGRYSVNFREYEDLPSLSPKGDRHLLISGGGRGIDVATYKTKPTEELLAELRRRGIRKKLLMTGTAETKTVYREQPLRVEELLIQ